MDMLSPLDFYCERIDTSFWSEPINALTNLSPLVAGLVGMYLSLQNQSHRFLLVSSVVSLAGLGSFLFHTFANQWSYWLDVVPIFIFQVLLLEYFLTSLLMLNSKFKIIAMAVFMFTTVFFAQPTYRTMFNGSLPYFPSLLALGVMVYSAYRRREKSVQTSLVLAFISFTLALLARSLDSAVCDIFPLGTHFLWHLFNGAALYALIQAGIHLQIKTQKS